MKKFLSVILVGVLFFTLCSCVKTPQNVIKDSDECIVITTAETDYEITKNTRLIDYMDTLKEKGELDFSIESGMITVIDGVKNANDFSKCWMLYTSDTEYSSNAFGTVIYDGKTYGSAIVGAGELPIKKGEIYIWYYQEF